MHRLAEFEHHVVRDVHDRADRAQARAAQALAHPERGRGVGAHAADDASREPGATRARLELDREPLARLRRHLDRRWAGERPVEEQRGLAGDALHAHAVAAVRRQVDVEDRVLERERFDEGRAGARLGRKLHEAGRVLGKAELAGRAEHPERLHAPQLRLADLQAARQLRTDGRERRLHARARVRRAADDLQGLGPRAHTAHAERVGVRVLHPLDDLAHHDARQRRRRRFDGLDLEARHREARGEVLRLGRDAQPILQPVDRDAHGRSAPLSRTGAGSAGRSRSTCGCRSRCSGAW